MRTSTLGPVHRRESTDPRRRWPRPDLGTIDRRGGDRDHHRRPRRRHQSDRHRPDVRRVRGGRRRRVPRRAPGRRAHHHQVPARRAPGRHHRRASSRSRSTRASPRCASTHVDVFFLHSNICEDDTVYAHGNDHRAAFATPWSRYVARSRSRVRRPATTRAHRRVGNHRRRPPRDRDQRVAARREAGVVQAIANLLDSPGGIRRYAEPARPCDIIAAADANGVGVMGIRAVQAGALTAEFDRPVKPTHPDGADYERAAPVPRVGGRARHRSRAAGPSLRARHRRRRHGRARRQEPGRARPVPGSRGARSGARAARADRRARSGL